MKDLLQNGHVGYVKKYIIYKTDNNFYWFKVILILLVPNLYPSSSSFP